MLFDIETLLDAMWEDYLNLNPQARAIHALFSKNNRVVNDHIAFRTFNRSGLRLETIATPFTAAGYQPAGTYTFKQKKLRARHYQHADSKLPKIFISELLVEELSPRAQRFIDSLVAQNDTMNAFHPAFLYSGRPWDVCSDTYEDLLQESEYAAWVAAFGFRPNHFTISINHLETFQTIQQVNAFLLEKGFALNTSGGLVKGSPCLGLEQSSTIANRVDVSFLDKTLKIPSCFYEFALRHPQEKGDLFQGFIAESADRIFESTNSGDPRLASLARS